MKITNIGGATAILEHKGKRILFDPWLNDGIFHGAWYHYPPIQVKIEDLGKLDYIYISHIHEDHCAAGTIQHLNRDAEVILMDREPNLVARFLEHQGFRFNKIHLIKPFTPVRIDDHIVGDMITADPRHEYNYLIDSALILEWDGFVIYNANDCPPYPEGLEYIKKTYGQVDLALLPYAGGSGYPACYTNLSHEEKLREKKRILKQGIRTFVETVQFLEPTHAMPFADQYVIAGSRSHLNQYLAHPPSPSVVQSATTEVTPETKLLLLNSGQSYDFSTEKRFRDEPYQAHTERDRDEYVEASLKDHLYEHEAFALDAGVPLHRLIHSARGRLWNKQEDRQFFPKFSYYLEVAGRNRRFHIPLDRNESKEVGWESPLDEPYLRISAPSALMALLLIGQVSWNIADAALFLDYERVPNVYEPKIHTFINYLRI